MSDALVTFAIESLEPADFERWVQLVLTKFTGHTFAPTGGLHDGGQDGYIRSVDQQPSHYVQISKQKDTSAKIRQTISRIRENRDLTHLIYITSHNEPERDLIESRIRKDLNALVTIHDLRWLTIQANLENDLKTKLFQYAHSLIETLEYAKNSPRELDYSSRLSIVTYLEAQAKSLPASANFHDLCLDTLIYEILIGTDPATDEFRTYEEIESHLRNNHPKALLKSSVNLKERLDFLSSKENLPRIRKHPVDRFALPFEVRNLFDENNTRIVNYESIFVGSIAERISEEAPTRTDELTQYVLPAVRHAIIETYRTQAMNFISSHSDPEQDAHINVYSIIENFMNVQNVPGDIRDDCISLSQTVFRRICYSSRPQEGEYLYLLMKYFTVKFVMDGDSAVTQYFSDMVKRLRVYLGTDIIVRCLSETFIKPSSRGMTNALHVLQEAGVKFRVTRQVLSEVFRHIHSTYWVFKHEYESWFQHATLQEVIHCDRILIRSFFYAYCEPEAHIRGPRDWSDFLNQFGNTAWFIDPKKHEDDFGSFLVDKYKLDFVEVDNVLKSIDSTLANSIAQDILMFRDRDDTAGNRILAQNDAEMALLINAERQQRNERVTSNLYGFDTWWMTEETTVLRVLRA